MKSQSNSGTSAAARLDRLPILPFHRRMLGLVGGGLFIDNFDIFIAGAILVVLLNSGWSTLELNATFISATFAGMLIGTIGGGMIADRFGRKFTFQLNLAIFGLASLACAAAPDPHLLIVARFICGIGLGTEIVVGYSTLAEFVPHRSRGRWLALLSMTSSFGLLAATILSFLLIPLFGWRVMFVLPGVAALIILWMRKSIPESPRWLELKGRHAEADVIVSAVEAEARARGLTLVEPEIEPIRVAQPLFQRKYIRPLVLGSIMQVVLFTALYGLVSWLPTFLTKQGMSINQSLGQSALMTLGGPAGAFFAQFLADRLGRRRAIIGGSILAAVMALIFGQVTSQIGAAVVGFATFCTVYFLIATVQAIYLPEIFPTEIRIRCNAVCVGIARISSIGVPFAVVYLFDRGGVTTVVTAIAILFVVQALVMTWLGAETAMKSLDSGSEEPPESRDVSQAAMSTRHTS
ncbi:MFS transporter [Burkholderiaceae bacterium 16]|nr:MFS transporter [Burkholderiaceae bacterium 16]